MADFPAAQYAADEVLDNMPLGIEPSIMQQFTCSSSYDAQTSMPRIAITCILPTDTIVNNQVICSIDKAIIRRREDRFPENENDGTLIATINQNGTIYDTDVEINKTYYYAAFPVSKNGVYNRSNSNRDSVKTSEFEYFYGYDLDLSDQNPNTRISYPSDVMNAEYSPAYMDFSKGNFNYGGWNLSAGKHFMPVPCMLRYNGTVDQYLNPNDYTKKIDGTASDVANTAFGGNAMMEWPKIYTKRWVEGGKYHFRCSDMPLDGEYDCWCNYDKNNKVIDHFYTPIYFGSAVSGRMRSISNQSNYVNNTAASEITLASANGEGWYTEFLADRLLIQDLLVLLSKSTDGQTKYGTGRCASGNTSAIGQGTMNTKGLFWGSNDQTSGVKVFGMENWWGNLWRRIAGWINANGTQKVKLTWGTHDGSTVSAFNTDGSGYITVPGATPGGTSGGYISGVKNDLPFGRIPVTASGSSSTNETDGLWFNNAQSNYAVVGGSWLAALRVGPFCALLDAAASHTYTSYGAALSCKPLAAA